MFSALYWKLKVPSNYGLTITNRPPPLPVRNRGQVQGVLRGGVRVHPEDEGATARGEVGVPARWRRRLPSVHSAGERGAVQGGDPEALLQRGAGRVRELHLRRMQRERKQL